MALISIRLTFFLPEKAMREMTSKGTDTKPLRGLAALRRLFHF
jgi:hypothetical protein